MTPYEAPYMVLSCDLRRLLGYVLMDNKLVQDCVVRNGSPFTYTVEGDGGETHSIDFTVYNPINEPGLVCLRALSFSAAAEQKTIQALSYMTQVTPEAQQMQLCRNSPILCL